MIVYVIICVIVCVIACAILHVMVYDTVCVMTYVISYIIWYYIMFDYIRCMPMSVRSGSPVRDGSPRRVCITVWFIKAWLIIA